MSKNPVVTIVDDDDLVRESTADFVTAMGLTAVEFPSAIDFLNSGRLHDTGCLIADVQMPGMTGIELHDRLRGSGIAIPTVLITAYPDDEDRSRALRAGVACYLAKPLDSRDLVTCIRRAIGPCEERGERTGETHG